MTIAVMENGRSKRMSNEELIQELQMIVDCIKQGGQDWVDETDIPTFEQVIEKLSKEHEHD